MPGRARAKSRRGGGGGAKDSPEIVCVFGLSPGSRCVCVYASHCEKESMFVNAILPDDASST